MCVWMDERWETRAGQCSDAQLFGERLIFLVSCAPIQAGLLEQHIYPPKDRRRTREIGGGEHSTIAYCHYDIPRHCTRL